MNHIICIQCKTATQATRSNAQYCDDVCKRAARKGVAPTPDSMIYHGPSKMPDDAYEDRARYRHYMDTALTRAVEYGRARGRTA